MRPTDEDQHGSMRPNLLSGGRRRFSGDDNILERLERDSARHASGNRSRAAWYAASASLVLLVIVFVAWMAFDTASTVQVVPMAQAPTEARPAVVSADPPPAAAPAPSLATSTTLAATAPQASAAASVEPPAIPARSGAIAALPPLVLLPSHETSVANRHRLDVASKPAPAAPTGQTKALAHASAPALRSGPSVVAARIPTKPAPPTRARKPVPAAAEPPVDTDVAVLSAIIIHDSAHAAEKAQLEAAATCIRNIEKKCAGRSSSGRD